VLVPPGRWRGPVLVPPGRWRGPVLVPPGRWRGPVLGSPLVGGGAVDVGRVMLLMLARVFAGVLCCGAAAALCCWLAIRVAIMSICARGAAS